MADENIPRRFNLAKKSIPIEIEMDGKVRNLRLVELTGTERDQWLNDMAARRMVGSDGKGQAPKNFTGLHAYLIHLSLEYTEGEDEGKKVPPATIQSWPSRVQNELHEMALELSGLTPKAAEEAKNDSLVSD